VKNLNAKLLGCAFLIGAALCGCGGADTSSPLAACKSAVSAVCDRSFACFPTGAQQLYGTVADCNARLTTLSCSPALTTCPAGTKFNPGGAGQCVDGYRNESCADLNNSVIPGSCNQNCI
jgi:hypothetical protein